MAAECGHKRAQFVAGSLCSGNEAGNGIVEQNYEKAVEWYLKSAEQGFEKSMINLAWHLMYGIGVKQDQKAAFEWYEKAAELGDTEAAYSVAMAYQSGMGGRNRP
ncbi:tetratricopeptide repeat protein [Aeromonas media]|uniref:tetratricopeptide repeat protein n=1 Tax=Aeromonas media TaxID=651 RepID=UPI003D197E2B